ncbi:MAG: SMP-30/gluconolactonase/LRE family protein [candidate division KSB1 bacterium]|nr:SMP-30/gluconolactonase/LRE family protein [candidate division KSB1 bacterium]
MHDLGAVPEVKTTVDMEPLKKMPAPVASDIPELPDVKDWVNLRDLGAAGDGVTDDTEVIRQAVQEHRVIFVPTGRYLVSETIKLRPNSVLIGMNPITTQLVLADDLDAFAGPGSPNALLETAKGGEAIVISIGLDTGAFNERAVAAKWMAGERSYMNDVRFVGGHGTYHPDGSHVPVYNKFRSGDPYRDRDWDTQYSSLWITDGGGGTFKDIWTPNSFAQAGLYISDTDTPGRIYAMSLEHHVRNEVMLRNVSNWRFFVMQMEEESAEGRHALPVWIQNCENLLFANTYLYRVIRMNSPYPQGILVNSSKNIEFCGLHVYSPTVYSFNTTLYDQTHGVEVRQRELARLTLSGNPPTQPQDEPAASAVLANGAKVEKVIDGFEFITGATADQEGNVYFVDSRCHHIYKWSPEEQNVSLIRNTPLSPVALGLDESGNLLVTTRDRHVVAFDPDQNGEQLQVLEPVDPDQHNAPIALIPGHMWRDEHDFLDITTYSEDNPPTTHSSFTIAHRLDSNPLKNHYVSPDNGVFIPEWQGLVRSVSLRRAVPGQPFYMADEFGQKTYKFKVNKNGLLTDPELFAERGELDVSVDNEGNVYIPAGDVYVYNPDGEQIDVIRVPERPATLVFGGKNRDTLYITARTSLYKIKTRTRGRVLE